jgi:hypothetical protein
VTTSAPSAGADSVAHAKSPACNAQALAAKAPAPPMSPAGQPQGAASA